jgi:hypothetical protein
VAKASGLGDDFAIGGYHIGGDIQSLVVKGGPALLDFTDITQSAYERKGGLRTGDLAIVSYHDTAAGQAHAALSPLPTADAIATYFRGQVIGNPCASTVAKQVDYNPTRDTAGNLHFAVACTSNAYGLEWGVQLTAGFRTDTAATDGTSWDFGAASNSNGAQAYLQCSAFTGTDVTVKLQDSADNSTFADVTGGGFTQITGSTPLAQRIATATNLQIKRYVRAVTVTSAGFTSVTFAVQITVNTTAVVF